MPQYRMFIDDTGNVHDTTSEHPQNRYAGIVGVILNLDYLHTRFEPSFKLLKQRHFPAEDGGKPPILHLRKMKKAEGCFAHLKDADVRAAWERGCFSMYERAQFTVVSVCVDKLEFINAYPAWPGGIYGLLVGNAIERYFYFLKNSGGTGDIMAEATNSDLDTNLKDLYARFWQDGTEHIPANRLRTVLSSKEIKIQPKSNDVAGLQLADLLAATCFSHSKRIHAGGADYDAFAMRVAELWPAAGFLDTELRCFQ